MQRIRLLEEPLEKDYGSDLLSLIAGYDVDAVCHDILLLPSL
jgi:hypothetical protein